MLACTNTLTAVCEKRSRASLLHLPFLLKPSERLYSYVKTILRKVHEPRQASYADAAARTEAEAGLGADAKHRVYYLSGSHQHCQANDLHILKACSFHKLFILPHALTHASILTLANDLIATAHSFA